jgi:hypothetical protein
MSSGLVRVYPLTQHFKITTSKTNHICSTNPLYGYKRESLKVGVVVGDGDAVGLNRGAVANNDLASVVAGNAGEMVCCIRSGQFFFATFCGSP